MIKTQYLTPTVYYQRSRDFQLLGRIYDIVFNYIKSGTELVKNLPFDKNTDDSLIELVATTLGLKHGHSYNIAQLRAVCSVFMLALRNKGSILSIQLAIHAIMHAEGMSGEPIIDYDYENKMLNLGLPVELKDLTLLLDVLDYILPAGVSTNVYRANLQSTLDIIDKYSEIGKDNIDNRLITTSRYVGVIPEDTLVNMTQADLGPSRNDSMVIPTDAEPEKIYPED